MNHFWLIEEMALSNINMDYCQFNMSTILHTLPVTSSGIFCCNQIISFHSIFDCHPSTVMFHTAFMIATTIAIATFQERDLKWFKTTQAGPGKAHVDVRIPLRSIVSSLQKFSQKKLAKISCCPPSPIGGASHGVVYNNVQKVHFKPQI